VTYLIIDWYLLPTWFNYHGQIPRYTTSPSNCVHATARCAALPHRHKTRGNAWKAADKLNKTTPRRFSKTADFRKLAKALK